MKNLLIFITLFISLTSLAQERASGVTYKEMKGKVMIYRNGASYQYDGVKKLYAGDIFQTLDNSTITLIIAGFHVTLAPRSYFQVTPSQNRKEIQVGRLIYGSVLAQLLLIKTNKEYVLKAPQFTSKAVRSQVIYTVARTRRELQQTLRGKVPKAVDLLSDAEELSSSPGLSTQISVISGTTHVTLGNKTKHTIVEDSYVEYRADGLSLKKKKDSKDKIRGYLKSLKIKLFPL